MFLIQSEDPSVFLDGVCTLLVTHCFLLSEPGRELGAILSSVAPFSLQKKHFTFDVSDVPSFGLSLLFPLLFSLPLSLPFSLPLPLPLFLPLPFMCASTSIGLVSFPSAMPNGLYA